MGRVLMVVRPSKGGAFGHVARLGLALKEAGHEVGIAGPHARHRGNLDLELIDVEMGRAIGARQDLAAIRALARAYREWRPDVIHAHGSKGGVIARIARVAAPRVPLVFTPHNYAFTNYFATAAERRVYRAIETGLAPLATRTLCVCEAERRIAASIGPAGRTRLAYNGVEPFRPADVPNGLLELKARGPVLLAVTEFSPPKGVPTLLDAMPLILTAFPEANLIMAGDGPLRPEVEGQIDRLGIHGHVHLLGMVPAVQGLLAGADLLVSPGWSESFPYAILEAMSAGIPIVATDVGGVNEAIEDRVTGRLVAPHDVSALAAAVTDVIADPVVAARLGSAAERRVAERFSFDSMVAATVAVYEEVGLR